MTTDYVSEAEALSSQYDGEWNEFEPYTDDEKREFINYKLHRFEESDKGKFVVAQRARRNRQVMSILYLADRSTQKFWWWTHDAEFAMKFNKKQAAEKQAAKYKYNNVKVLEIK